MKKTLLLVLPFALLSAPLLHAQTPFTYQGKLENSGTPFTGTVHIRLGLYGTLNGGSPLRTEILPNVAVAGGIFTATPSTFTASDFPGAARYLNIEVSSDGGGSYTPLTPRQQVTWTPYSLYAATAASATSVTGPVSTAQLSGSIPPALLGTGSISGTVTFNPAAGAPFSVGANGTLVTNLNADKLDGLTSTDFLRTTGGTLSGDLSLTTPAVVNFGLTARQMINLYGQSYAIGIQTNTLYQRSQEDWSWHRGGIHNDGRNVPGTGGTEVMRLTGVDLRLDPNSSSTGEGRIVFGNLNSSNSQPYVSVGESASETDTLELVADRVRVATNTPGILPSISFGATTGQHLVLYQNAADTYGIGVQASTQYFRTGEQFAWYKDGIHSDTANAPGAGGSTLMTLSGEGSLTLKGASSGLYQTNRDNANQTWAVYSRNSGTTGQLAFWNSTTGSDVAAMSPNGDMYLVGQLSTSVLTIRGGADVAEPFETTKPEELEPGTVVIIDEDNPGKLKKSDGSYDTRVAGIISGAGGVKPGLRLHQEGVLEGDHHVALSGRVYVKADASTGKIKPGDLLTTSSTPGHAMKVKDNEKAQGAILGKAMTKLDSGTGLVLVLVTLQ